MLLGREPLPIAGHGPRRHEGVAASSAAPTCTGRARSAPLIRDGARRPGLTKGCARMASIDELLKSTNFTTAEPRPRSRSCPSRRAQERKYTVISVDDHIVEPPDTFEGRMPAKFADRAPQARRTRTAPTSGSTTGRTSPTSGFNAVVGRPVERVRLRAEPLRRDAPRRVGHPRAHRGHGPVRRLRLAVLPVVPARASPASASSWRTKDPELALATVRAWNDWNLEEWCRRLPGPDDPVPAAVLPRPGGRARRRSTATPSAGFKAVTFSEAPHKLGLPSLHTGHWDPIMRACAETGTVVNLHIGSSGTSPSTVRRRAAGRGRRALLRLRDVRRGRLAVLADPRALPRHQDLPVRGRHRLGGRPASTGSTTC